MAQTIYGTEAIMLFMGYDDPQDIDQEEMERLSALIDNPVMINDASLSQLRSCGLFTAYQVAVLDDYRSRHGDVVSLLELSLLDGFSDDFTIRLKPFISLVPKNAMRAGHNRIRHDVSARTGYRWSETEGSDYTYATKYRLKDERKYSVAVAVSRPIGIDSWYPSSVSGSFMRQLNRVGGKLLVGDFNARFGQGLTMWNGTFMTGLTTPDSFMKKPTGLSQPWSFTGSTSMSGVAADLATGPLVISTFVAFPGLKDIIERPESLCVMPAVNLAWYGRYGQISVTNVYQSSLHDSDHQVKTGIDAAFCIKGVNLFGEVSADWTEMKVKALLGSRFRIGESMDMALQLRGFQSEQLGAAVGGEYSKTKHRITFSTDCTYYPVSKDRSEPYSLQLKSQVLWEMQITPSLHMKMRVSERIRTWGLPFRTDVRADIRYDVLPFSIMLRMNALNCDRTGFLSYAEGSYIVEKISLHLRHGLFLIDDWDDRIYVYERDAPGSFNAPAMYGRGMWTSAVAGLKLSYKIRLYARAAYTCYPFMEPEKKKPGKAELKLQLQCRF